jgi:hypothetical protein
MLMIGLSWVLIGLCVAVFLLRHHAVVVTTLVIPFLIVGGATAYTARHLKDGFKRMSG